MKLLYKLVFNLALFLVMVSLVSCATTSRPDAQPDSANIDSTILVRDPALRVDAEVSTSQLKDPDAPEVTSAVDAQSILDHTCAQCHVKQSLLSINQPRSAWESALQQMEKMGVHLSETEQAVLLDYLSGSTGP
jgi:hypothetical protein